MPPRNVLKLYEFLLRLTPLQAAFSCFLLGAVLTLAFAPFDLWPLAAIALSGFFVILNATSSRTHCLLRTYCFGYGFFMAGTWWMAKALLVDAAQFGWLVPFCVIGLTGVYALWFLAFGALYWFTRTRNIILNLLRFTILWVLVEYLHSLGMFGFPWNLAGYIALSSLRMSQFASLFGVYGLSFVVVLMALMPVLFLNPQPKKYQIFGVSILLGLPLVLYAFGMIRMEQEPAMSDARVRVVQAAIPQAVKWTNEGKLDSLDLHARLSRVATDGPPPRIVIWPESAFPFTLYEGSSWPSRLATLVPHHGTLITGTVRAEEVEGVTQFYNSIVAIDWAGYIAAAYDKHQLVPFGEFVPFRALLPMNKITPGAVDFLRGKGPQTLAINGVPPFSPLVCYEAVFADFATHHSMRPAWLLNVTNDGWYGNTPGPYQHFAMARMRAVEQGLPLVRAANNGISAVVDPYGQILRMLHLNARGVIDQTLPKPLHPTLYSQFKEIPLVLAFIALWGWTILQRKKVS